MRERERQQPQEQPEQDTPPLSPPPKKTINRPVQAQTNFGLPRGIKGQRPDSFTPPDARWMDDDDFKSAADYIRRYNPHQGTAVLLGASQNNEFIASRDDRHVLTVAGSRSGKGVSAIIPNLIFYDGSILVIDPKGENANKTARRRANDLGQRVHVLDPFRATKGRASALRASYNPLTILYEDSETLAADAELIADAFVISSGAEKTTHWDDTARNFIEAVILHVVTAEKYKDRCDLVTVRDLLTRGVLEGPSKTDRMQNLYAEMEKNTAADGIIQAGAADLAEKPDEERGSVISTARRHTKLLDLRNLQDVLQDHHFNLTDLKTAPEGMTVYLCVPASRLGVCARWFRLFVNLVMNAAEAGGPAPREDLPLLMILDEFPVLGHMRQIEDAAGQIAGFGVKLWPIIQDLGQLQALYKDRWQTFMGNAGVIQFFGNNDTTTLKWISERCGQTRIIHREHRETTLAQEREGLTGTQDRPEHVPLIAPDEAALYFGRDTERQLVIHAGSPPLALKRLIYWRDPLFKGLYDE